MNEDCQARSHNHTAGFNFDRSYFPLLIEDLVNKLLEEQIISHLNNFECSY